MWCPRSLPQGGSEDPQHVSTASVGAGSLHSLPSEKMNLPPPTFQPVFLLDAGAEACGESCCRARVEAALPRDAASAPSAQRLPARGPVSGVKLNNLRPLCAVSCTPAAWPGWAWVAEGGIPLKTQLSPFGLHAD